MQCHTHKDNALTMVCVSCDNKLMCMDCIDEHTEEHAYKPIKVVAKKVKEDLQAQLSSNTTEISVISKKMKEIGADQNEQDDIVQAESDRIKKQCLAIRSIVDKIGSDQIKLLSEQKQKNNPVLKDEMNRLRSLLKVRSAYDTHINSILTSSNEIEIILKSRLLSPPKPLSFPTFSLQPIEYCVGQTDKYQIQRIVGRVTGSPEEEEEVSDFVGSLCIQPQALSTSQHAASDFVGSLHHHQALSTSSTFSRRNSDYADYIRPSTSNCMWVRWCCSQDIELTDKQGNVMQRIKFSNVICGFRMTQNHQLLVCGYSDKCIYQVQFGCKPTVCFKTQFRPLDIYPLDDGNMIVSVRDSYGYAKTSESKRMVLKYNHQGQVISSAEFHQFGEALFVCPVRLNVNSEHTIVAVINYTSETSSHLVLLDFNLKLKIRMFGFENVVPGNRKVHTIYNEHFCVNDVYFDGNEMIISEDYSRSLMLLNSQCVVLRILWKDELMPVSFCLSLNGEIWCSFANEENGIIEVLK